MRAILSAPALIILGWGIGLILFWEHRYRALNAAQLPWLIVAMVLIALAMVVALAGVPGQRHEHLLRAGLAVEGCVGAWMLARRLREETSRDR